MAGSKEELTLKIQDLYKNWRTARAEAGLEGTAKTAATTIATTKTMDDDDNNALEKQIVRLEENQKNLREKADKNELTQKEAIDHQTEINTLKASDAFKALDKNDKIEAEQIKRINALEVGANLLVQNRPNSTIVNTSIESIIAKLEAEYQAASNDVAKLKAVQTKIAKLKAEKIYTDLKKDSASDAALIKRISDLESVLNINLPDKQTKTTSKEFPFKIAVFMFKANKFDHIDEYINELVLEAPKSGTDIKKIAEKWAVNESSYLVGTFYGQFTVEKTITTQGAESTTAFQILDAKSKYTENVAGYIEITSTPTIAPNKQSVSFPIAVVRKERDIINFDPINFLNTLLKSGKNANTYASTDADDDAKTTTNAFNAQGEANTPLMESDPDNPGEQRQARNTAATTETTSPTSSIGEANVRKMIADPNNPSAQIQATNAQGQLLFLERTGPLLYMEKKKKSKETIDDIQNYGVTPLIDVLDKKNDYMKAGKTPPAKKDINLSAQLDITNVLSYDKADFARAKNMDYRKHCFAKSQKFIIKGSIESLEAELKAFLSSK